MQRRSRLLVARRKGDCLLLFPLGQGPAWGGRRRAAAGRRRSAFLGRWRHESVRWTSDWSAEQGLFGSLISNLQSGVRRWRCGRQTNPDADKPVRVLIPTPTWAFGKRGYSPNGRWLSFLSIRRDRPGTVAMLVASADRLRPEHWTRIAPDHDLAGQTTMGPGRPDAVFPLTDVPAHSSISGQSDSTPSGAARLISPSALTQFDSPEPGYLA